MLKVTGLFGRIDWGGSRGVTASAQFLRESLAWRGRRRGHRWLDEGVALAEVCRGRPGADREWSHPGHSAPLVAHARLDRKRALAHALGEDGLADRSDHSLIFAAWRRWGPRCVEHLDGDFAFALWDEQQRALFCARDRMGLKPFYYARDGSELAFASSASSVAASGVVERRLDAARVADFLAGLEGVDLTSTFFRDVQRLPPAHCLLATADGMRCWRYWEPRAAAMRDFGSDEAWADAFESVLDRAVRERSSDQVACALSGGVDSATLAALVRKNHGRVAAVSGVADAPERCPESRAIKAMAGLQGYRVITHTPDSLATADPAVLAAGEEPWDRLQVMLSLLYRTAAEQGFHSVIDGVDGDLVVGLPEHYPRYLASAGLWITAWREARAQGMNYYGDNKAGRSPLRRLGPALVPGLWAHRARRFMSAKAIASEVRRSLVSNGLARDVDLAGRILHERVNAGSGRHPDLESACHARMSAAYLTAAVERYERVAARWGLASRKPLLDPEVLSFCLALPWDQKAREGWSKFILRRVAARHLPDAIPWRVGFDHLGWAFNEARFRACREADLAAVLRHRERLEDWIRTGVVASVVERLQAPVNIADDRLRRVVDLAAWLDFQDI